MYTKTRSKSDALTLCFRTAATRRAGMRGGTRRERSTFNAGEAETPESRGVFGVLLMAADSKACYIAEMLVSQSDIHTPERLPRALLLSFVQLYSRHA